ncbi:CoA-binding protein [Thioclava sp. BHET1]|nr:CoA-binding protein [Thioclava sp. BHET1]
MPAYTDALLRHVLRSARVIAVVGASARPERAGFYVPQFLIARGYRVIPVNPGLAGQRLWDEPVYAKLSDVTETIDMIDIFRRPDAVAEVVTEALEALPALRVIWMQLGVENAEAAATAEARGVTVIQDRCPKIEFPRLFGAKTLREITAEG